MVENQDPNAPATKGDLAALKTELKAELKAELTGMEDRLLRTIADSQAVILEKTQEFVRDNQTEILRAIHAFATSIDQRNRRLIASDASHEERILTLEQRLTAVELKILGHRGA